ncbi:MAG TPA: membrane protein insertion efficiency factor YidD [Blastococcus sp.]|jgi:hypothetical protein|nr:membrane protein insertion efficiency factor YidD [Blastococcus sp.]
MVFIWGSGWGPRRRRGYGPPPGWGGGYGPPPGYGYGGRGYGGRGYGRRGYGGGGGSCLRDLLLLDAGCCIAESIGCGANMVLLAPTTVRHVHAATGERGRMTERLIAAVRVYQREVSPKRAPCCKYSPTCSAYAVEALEQHGARRGTWLTLRRLLRCRPGAAGGADPVPVS